MTATRSRTLIVAAVVVIGAAIVAVIAGRGGSSSPSSTTGPGSPAVHEVAAVTMSGTLLADLPDSGQDTAIGKTVPVVRGTDFTGKPVTIGAPGSPQLLWFVAHWCPHCRNEVPKMVQGLATGTLTSETRITAVSTAVSQQRDNYPPSTWLRNEHWTGPVLVDSADDTAAHAYGLTAFPYWVAVDRTGKVVARVSGELTIAQVQQLLAAAARG